MKISVICVCLNSEKTIGYTIDSFLGQTHTDKELIIVDGVSHDRTTEIARAYRSEAIQIVSEKDRGLYDAMNKGLALFRGDAVGVIGSDDTFHGNHSLALIADALEQADIAYGDIHFVTDHVTKHVKRIARSGEFRSKSFQKGWQVPHPAFYMRRSVAEAVGQFDLRYKVAADYDYIVRAMALNSFRHAYIPEVLVDFQIGGKSTQGTLRSLLAQNGECLDSRRRRLGAPAIDAAYFLKPTRSLLQKFVR